MNRHQLPQPPNPASYTQPLQWQRAMYDWALKMKQHLETDSAVNTAPIAPFMVGTYTAVNTVTGTDTLSNFVATLITAMNQQGITSPVSQRINNA